MLTFNIPIIVETKSSEENKLVKERKTLKCQLDTSIASESRWEDKFPNQANSETLFDYISRLQSSKQKQNIATIISQLKAIYCFIVFPENKDKIFLEFERLFCLNDKEYLDDLIKAINDAFSLVYPNEKKSD